MLLQSETGPENCERGAYPRKGIKTLIISEQNRDENQHVNLREMVVNHKITHESILTIIVDILGMRRIAERLVSEELIFFKKIIKNKCL